MQIALTLSQRIAVLLLASFLAGCATSEPAERTGYDLLLRDGLILDGSGSPGYRGDVAVRDGRIVAVGAVPQAPATQVIDLRGLAVAPGFIDVHTHVDDDIHKSPLAENFIRDGVTTIISGNCGGSVTHVGAYLARVDREGAAVNCATLVGHNTILKQVKGDNARPLTSAELDAARARVDQAMREGAMGLSTGLIYNPGQYSPIEEIVELQKVAAKHGGLYATHMRSEGAKVLDAIDEALRIGREARCRVEISHFKLAADTSRNIGGSDVTLGRVLKARQQGQDVWLDQYPYAASSTSLSTLITDEFLKDGIEAAQRRLRTDPKAYDELLAQMLDFHGKQRKRTHFGYVVIASCRAIPKYNGRNILEITRSNKAGAELLRDDAAATVSLEDQCRTLIDIFKAGGASCVFHSMAETDVENILRHPIVSVASDSGIREFGMGVPHPRGYGTNSRVLGHYVRQRGIIPVEEAVRKMTSQPAYVFGLRGRGLLKAGYHADITVFDPATVIDRATFELPHQYPEGIPTVIVNGVVVLRDGRMTGAKPGRAVYGPGKRFGD